MNLGNEQMLKKLIHKKQVVGIVCNQWGDTGKGKIVDLMGEYFDVEARGTGGANAGHTAIVNGEKRVSHLLPMGTANDKTGKISIMGKGMVIEIATLNKEIEEFHSAGGTTNNLWICSQANVIMPYHIQKDVAENKSQANGGIGSTGRGIGPCYADATARNSIIIADLFDKTILAKKINKVIKYYPDFKEDIEKTVEELYTQGQKIKGYVRNTDKEVQNLLKQGKKILLEGAQGLLLSIDYGINPHVTSSDCSIYGTAQGAGLSPSQVDLTLGIVKFPLMTRVGGGPFPTEFKEENYGRTLEEDLNFYKIMYRKENSSLKYDHNDPKIVELKQSSDDTLMTAGIRLSGEEFGATTGRPRRIGWIDLPLLRKAIQVNGPNIILTKLDMAKDLDDILVADRYNYNSNFDGDIPLSSVENFYGNSDELAQRTPNYVIFDGFSEDISNVERYTDLPAGSKGAINYLIEKTGANVKMISVGPDRNQTFMK
jgi:adenylosuccinate synthase